MDIAKNLTYILAINLFAYIFDLVASCAKFIWRQISKLCIIASTLKRDVQLLYVYYIRITLNWLWLRHTNQTIFKLLDKLAAKNPERVCFYFEDQEWTYGEVQEMSFRVGNYFKGRGCRKGDVVALAMTNRPETICMWLGLSRLGVVTSLINTNLRGDSLQHSLTVVPCKGLIIGSEMRLAFEELWEDKWKAGNGRSIPVYELYEYNMKRDSSSNPQILRARKETSLKTIDLATCLKNSSSEKIIYENKYDEPRFLDTFCLIFTSGTTGMPKAARCSHGRLVFLSATSYILNIGEKDVGMCPIPTYHVAGLMAICWALVDNAPVVIIKKFSASRFWKDVNRYKVTVCFYIGELVRFIINQLPQPEFDRNHTLRAMFGGGGLRPEVWATFLKRFEVKQFVDIYASTEGNCTLVNMEGRKIGAVGYIPLWMQPIHPITIVKVDPITEEIIRDKNTGLGIICKANESGELVGQILNNIPTARFDGYTDKAATEKKIAKDLFRKGDKYFRTGDIVVRDEFGYFYFKDRMGDTFRWKAENVATVQVEGVISILTGMRPNVVYGVKIPGTEGRAGMAAISDPDGTLDLNDLYAGFNKELPPHARPVFVRCVRDGKGLSVTGTFKLQKFNIQQEAYEMGKISDPIYIYTENGYKLMNAEIYQQIIKGSYRL